MTTLKEPTRRKPRSRVAPPIWFLVPALVPYIFVVVSPTVSGSFIAFTDWNGISPDYNLVGLENFIDILSDPDASGALFRTLYIALVVTVLQNVIGLLLALGVNSKIKSRNVLRIFLFAPAVMTPIVTAFIWRYMMTPDGTFNEVLTAVGLSGLRQDWLGNPTVALGAIIAVAIWQSAGFSMVIYLAGLQGVPGDVLEAASMDGAGPVRTFWSIVRPMLLPATIINLMLSVIAGLKLFDPVWALTQGGPGHTTETLATLIYKNAFTLGEFGYSAAMAVVLTILVAVISIGQYTGLNRSGRSA